MTLDPPTVFVLLVAATFANSVLLFWSWIQYRGERSLLFTAIGFAAAGLGSILLAGRGRLPDLVTIDVANSCVLYSHCLIWVFVRVFNRQTPLHVVPFGAVVLMLALFQIPAIDESFGLRTLVVSAPGAFFCLLAARELLVRDGLRTRAPLAIVIAVHGVFLIARIISAMTLSPDGAQGDFEGPWFLPYALETLVFVQFVALLILALTKERAEEQQRRLRRDLETAYSNLQKDVDAAAAVQQELIPGSCQCNEIRFVSLLKASRFISGDTFNVFEPGPGRIAFFSIDVSGHGAAAALVSVTAYNELTERARNRPPQAPQEIIAEELNKEWPQSLPYFTVIFGEIDVAKEMGSLVQAGHPPGLLITSDGEIRTVGNGGSPIGLVIAGSYEAVEFQFKPGDRLLLHSDGVTDAASPDGGLFSEERLVAFLKSKATLTTDDLVDELSAALVSWHGADQFDDDVSVVVIERLTVPTAAGRNMMETPSEELGTAGS